MISYLLDKIYIGNNLVEQVFLGTNLVYGRRLLSTPSGEGSQTTTVLGQTEITLTFEETVAAGNTTITYRPIAEESPLLPGDFSITNNAAIYNIETTADFTGDILLCFNLSHLTEEQFDTARIFHYNSNGETNDITVLTGENAPDPINKTLCGLTSSFSEFYILYRNFADYLNTENSFKLTTETNNNIIL